LYVNRYRQPQLNAADALELMRWSAGYFPEGAPGGREFPYPAGLTGPDDEMGSAWEAEVAALHALTESVRCTDTSDDAAYDALLQALVETCCASLIEIAQIGLIGDYQKIDLYVGSTDEHGDVVRDRNAAIKQRLAR
jgi:hypothetical protein